MVYKVNKYGRFDKKSNFINIFANLVKSQVNLSISCCLTKI